MYHNTTLFTRVRVSFILQQTFCNLVFSEASVASAKNLRFHRVSHVPGSHTVQFGIQSNCWGLLESLIFQEQPLRIQQRPRHGSFCTGNNLVSLAWSLVVILTGRVTDHCGNLFI